MIVKDLFKFKTGSLEALEKLDDGNIPLVYGTENNNGVVKFVCVDDDQEIFAPPLITVSYLGTSFVQTVPFTTSVVDKSNIIILEPKKKMSLTELYFYCYQINKHGKFGFNYGRRMNMRRLEKLNLLPFDAYKHIEMPNVSTREIIPEIMISFPKEQVDFCDLVDISTLFELVNARSRGYELYDKGEVAFVSNGFYNKGIMGYVEPYEDDRIFKGNCISISAFCEAIVQEDDFVARGNGGSGLTVLKPKFEMDKHVLDIYASYINNFCKWRFSYGRMVSVQRLNKLKVPNYIINKKG